jgi:hypothetical protein
MNFINQIQISENNQGFYLTEFQLDSEVDNSYYSLIDQFIKSDRFTYDCLPEMIKKNKNNPDFYLRQLFDNEKISSFDFQRLDINGLIDFFDNYANHNDGGEDQEDFLKVYADFKTKLSVNKSVDYFLLSKDSFNSDSEKIRNPEGWIYIYYFLVIWVDRQEKKLLICEWNYD